MKTVRMLSIDAGPTGTKFPGKTYPVSDLEAAELVEGGFAEYATTQPVSVAVAAPAETAATEPEETAAPAHKPGPKGKRK